MSNFEEHLLKSSDWYAIAANVYTIKIIVEFFEECLELGGIGIWNLECYLTRYFRHELYLRAQIWLKVFFNLNVIFFGLLNHCEIVADTVSFFQEETAAQAHELTASHDAYTIS